MRISQGSAPQKEARWIIAGNRFGAHRAVSTTGSGNKMMSGRLHKSPPVDLIGLAVVYPWYVVDTVLGEIASGSTSSVACGLECPLGVAPGTAQAFKFGGSFTGALVDFQTLYSDPLEIGLSANSVYRLRPYGAPSAFMPFGRPGLGTSGGSMSGFGGEVDRGVFSASATNLTQVNTAMAALTSDSFYEPVLIGVTEDEIDSWMLVGDSITVGNAEITGSSGAAPAGAGDAYGNAGFAERAMGIKDVPYVNLAKSGSAASIWATNSERRIGYFQQFCNKGLLAIGRNDLGFQTATQIIASITTIYRAMARNMDVWVSTIVPAVQTVDGTTLAGQTLQPYESDRQTVNAFIRGGTVIPANRVFDFEAAVRDTSDGGQIKWRVDGGPWSSGGLHPEKIAHIAGATAFAALL